MRNTMKRVFSCVLVVCMMATVLAMAGCGSGSGEAKSYTYKTYSTSLGNNWNPHTWETNADDTILSYLSTGFVDMSILNSEDGIYQWVYEMATSIEDVTKDHKDDLTKYNVTFADGKNADNTDEGYVYEIKLNKDAKWQNGTKINADTYIYSMKAMLDPAMKNYRSNLYWSGESAVAGGIDYYYAGDTAYLDNGANAAYAIADLKKGADGYYTTPDGAKVYVALDDALAWTSGNSLGSYVDAYGSAYFGVDAYNKLRDKADANGRVQLNDESLDLIVHVITDVADWGETKDDAMNYLVYAKEYPVVDYDSTVGCYKVDDYTIRYVNQFAIDKNYFLVSCTSTWLVYEDLYEGGKDTSGELVTTNYNSSVETTMSYGPYKLESVQQDKQIVFVQNENWYGYQKRGGGLYSETNFEVDGKKQQQYQTTRIVIDVMDDAAGKQAFLKGELSSWSPDSDDLVTYSASDQLYKVDETYTMSFFFNCGLDNLKEMDKSKGNKNSVVLSNTDFRKAFSLGIDRAEWVTATPGYKPAYALMNTLYFYDVYNDPNSSYRGSDEAMQAVCNLYGVQYGAGTPYATLKEAYQSINGYNLTEAKTLMKAACDQLVKDGLYKAGEEIKIRVGYKKGALDSADNKQMELMNKYINAAAEGSGFGKITLEAVGNINDRYGDVAKGEFAIGYGAWGGAAFYPFRNFRVYMDPSYVDIHEAGCWDPTTTKWTLKVKGQDVTMTCQDWSNSLTGNGQYANEDFSVKLSITAQLEEMYLKLYYRIPLAGSTACELLSYQCKYYTEDYNIMYGFGGIRLMSYNYDDTAWAEFVASQNGTLNYE